MNDIYSIKPFFLDSILSWCVAQGKTPILIIKNLPKISIPKSLSHLEKMAFNIGFKAITDKVITTDHLSFYAFFPQMNEPQYISLPIETWIGIRIKETNDFFNFDFHENLLQQKQTHQIWPNGFDFNKSHEQSPYQNTTLNNSLIDSLPVSKTPSYLHLVCDNTKKT